MGCRWRQRWRVNGPPRVADWLESAIMLRSPRRLWRMGLVVVLSLAGGGPTGTGRRHQRGSGTGDSQRREVPQGTPAGRRIVARRRSKRTHRGHQPGRPGLAHGRRETRLAHHPADVDVSPRSTARNSSTAPMRSGFRPWSSPPPIPKPTVRGWSPTSIGSSEPNTKTRAASSGPETGRIPRSGHSPATTPTPSTRSWA